MKDFSLDIAATTKDGVEVPVKITVEYPDNQGIIAYQALRHVAENQGGQILAGLASAGDLSLLEVMQDRGVELDDNYDDED